MKQAGFSLLTVLIFSSIAFSQPYSETDLQYMNLKGKVGSVLEKVYEATRENGIVSAGKLQWSVFYKFDKEGNMITKTNYAPDGSMENTVINTYSKPGLLAEKQAFLKGNKLWYRKTQEYNADNYLIKYASFDSTGKVEEEEITDYKFKDPYNYVETTKSEDKKYSKNMLYIDSITLNKNNNVIHSIHHGGYYENATYSYNSGNRVTQKILKDSLGIVETEIYYEYDEKGNMVKTESNYPVNKTKYLTTIAYTYDETGNWIKKIEDAYGKTTITERKVDYSITSTPRRTN